VPGPGFRIADAYTFASENDLAQEAENIASMEIHPSITRQAAVRKGHFIQLFENAGLMEAFVEGHWPTRHTQGGERRYHFFLQRMRLNARRVEGDLSDEETEIDDDSFDETPAFALESQLRDFVAGNLARIGIDSKKIVLFRDANGRDGVEYPTAVGNIDILGTDDEGTLYVFELKLSRGPDRAVGQLARYMGWIKHHLASGKKVVGVVVASDIDDKTRYAASMIPDVVLLEYEVQFQLTRVADIDAGSNEQN
jgi:hypothetical protein